MTMTFMIEFSKNEMHWSRFTISFWIDFSMNEMHWIELFGQE